MQSFKRIIDIIDKIAKWLSIAAFSIMTIMVVLQIIFRYVLGASLSFSEELARYMFVWSVLLGSALALKKRSHVNVELVVNYMPLTLKKYATLLANIIGLAFYMVLIVYGFKVFNVTLTQTSASLGISMGMVYLSIPVAGIIMLLDGIYNTIEDFINLSNKKKITTKNEVNKA